jgi:hypothetical protein
MSGKYDVLWKGMVEEVIEDLLRFVDPLIESQVDFSHGFQFLDKELQAIYPGKLGARVVDKLVQVRLRTGGERLILLHIEIQNANDKDFPRRMFEYYYRILDRHRLPVAALAVMTGRKPRRRMNVYRQRCLWTRQEYEYKTIRVGDYTDKDLIVGRNSFALAMMIAKKVWTRIPANDDDHDRLLLDRKLMIVQLLEERKAELGGAKYMSIMTFLDRYVLFKKPENHLTFIEKVDQITGKPNTMGVIEQLAEITREEGIELGSERKGRLVVENLLKDSGFPIEKIAALADVPVEFVRQVRREVHAG